MTLSASAQEQNTFDNLDLELRESLAQGEEVTRSTGLRLGSFQVDPVLEIGISHEDHETRKTLSGEVAAVSQWSRHSLRLETQAEIEMRHGAMVSDWSAGATLTGRRDISERLNVTGELRLSHQASDGDQDQTQYGTTGTLVVTPGPLELTLRSSLDFQHVGDPVAGEDANNDFLQAAGSLRAAHRRNALLSPFVEVDVADQHTGVVSGFDGDAMRWNLRTGIQIDRGEKLSGEASIGVGGINTDDAQRNNLSALLWSASLAWSPVRLTNVTLEASGSLGFSETTDLTSSNMASGTRDNTFALRAERSFNYRLDGFTEVSYNHSSYGGIDRTDYTFAIESGLTYNLTPDSSLLGQVTHERTHSSGADQSESDEISNGVSLSFQLRR